MSESAIIAALARIEARQTQIEAMLTRLVQDPQQVHSVAAEINHVRTAGGDLAQHFRERFKQSRRKSA